VTGRAIFVVFPLLLATILPPGAPAQTAAQANAALTRDDYPGAEKILRAALKIHPTDPETLSLLGMALDGEQKLAEADGFHKRAMAGDPRSAEILARYAQHLLTSGDTPGARDIFRKALALDPGDRFANLQFAKAALAKKDAQTALSYLDHIRASEQSAPEVEVQRLVALDLNPQTQSEANALFTRLSQSTEKDANAGSAIGWTLAQAGKYDQAEVFLTHAYAAAPSDFHVLYDLGVVALYANHYERAKEVLGIAQRQQPQNVDVLYSLAFAESTMHEPEAAIQWLAQAGQLAPQRADVQRLLAVTASELGAFEDSAAAWDRYGKLAPTDDTARREHGFALIHIGKFDAGFADLEWYAGRHPDDPMGLYELGTAQAAADPTQGIANLDKAIAKQPDFPAARAVRGSLYYRQGNPEQALPDLEAVAAETKDSAVLDRLGQTYLALNRLDDAIKVLRRAADLPGEPTVLLHLANALAEAGQTAESDSLLQRYKQARPTQGPVDLMRFLSLTPEQQRADYRSRVEKAIADNPRDALAQSRYMKLELEDNEMDQAAATARLIAGLKPAAGVLVDDGRALLEARQFVPAKELLSDAGPSAGVDVDLAIATFHAMGRTPAAATQGLAVLDKAPEASRNSAFYLAQAQMLEASNKTPAALGALDTAIHADPHNSELYWQKAMLLTLHQRAPEALRLLDAGAKALPKDSSIPLTRAAVLELSGRTDEALSVLDEVQRTWPEVAGVWVAKGIILAQHKRYVDASRALETAETHGARSAEARACLAAAAHQQSATPNPENLFENSPPRDW
jgi:tetratricopeptide (TPR) repeat protein